MPRICIIAYNASNTISNFYNLSTRSLQYIYQQKAKQYCFIVYCIAEDKCGHHKQCNKTKYYFTPKLKVSRRDAKSNNNK